jgi:ABC-type antimicrobial peptide transport system permease subunit
LAPQDGTFFKSYWRGRQAGDARIVIGVLVALALTRTLSSFSHLLYGVKASDPFTFIAVSLTLATVAIFACYIPARRATRIDPIIALRHD